MKKNSVGSFRKKAVLTRKTAIAATSIVLAIALIATVAFGLIPNTAIKASAEASAETVGLISSASGKNYLPDTYTPVNVPAGTYGMTEEEYKNGLPHESDGVAAFDFHIFAKNFASKAHTCGNIAVENLGGSAAGSSGAPEFGSRPNHDTNSIKLSYVENIHDWSSSAQADAFVFGPNNTVTENHGQVFVETPSGKYMMGNGKKIMDKVYIDDIDDETPFIDIDKELQDAEDYQRYLVWLNEYVRANSTYVQGWGHALQNVNGQSVRVLTHPDVAGWGWFGTTIDFSKYTEDTIIVDLDLYDAGMWGPGSNAQNLINGSVTLKGTAGKRIIFNVESSSSFNGDSIKFADTDMKADKMSNSEDSVKLDNNILWNFYQKDSKDPYTGKAIPNSTTGTITVGGTWMGTILAPNATVKCTAGLNGSIIAKEVTTSAETHKSDYTGEKVTKSDVTTFPVTKIWQDDPLTRPEFITIKLLQNNKAYKTIQLSAKTEGCVLSDFDSTGKYAFQWDYVFEDLPVTDGRGVSYRYDVEEVVPKGYTSNVVNNMIINSTKEGRQEPQGEPKLATLTFNKRAEGKPAEFLKGAEFKMTIDNGASLAGVTATSGVSNFKATDGEVTWTSTDAAAVFANLPYGNYTITETKAPAGYLTANPVTVKVEAKTAEADMIDKPVEIKLAKLESVNNDMLPGAELKLTADWGQNLSGVEVTGAKKDSVNKSANSITWTSDKGVVTIKGIAPGSYTLSETKAPMGYDVAAPVTFIVENDGTVKVNGQAKSRVEMIDTLTPEKEPEPVYYNITINKVNEAKSVSLPGAKLQLTAVGNIELDDVTVTDAKDGTVVKSGNTITWETNGSAVSFGNLPAGSYTLSEISAPEGYKTASPMTFTVSANGSYEMIDKAIEMSISKKDAASGIELAGATLTLTSKDDSETTDINESKDLTGVTVTGAKTGSVSKSGNTITWITDGSVVSFSGLPAGKYTLSEFESESETGVPVGYKKAADIEFEVDAYGNVSGTNVSGNTCTMYDEPVIVKIAKQYSVQDAETGNPVTGNLAGAELQLTGTNDLSKVTGSITLAHPNANTITWTSTSAANSLRGLPDGTYTLHEISAPEGFVLAQDITIVVEGGVVTSPTLNSNGEIVMTDEKEQFSSMVFTKIDADEYINNNNNVVLVEGAEMGVFKKDTESFAPENAELVFTSKTAPEKVMLPNGEYVLVELKAPEGYEKTDEKMYFTVFNGELTVTSFDAAELAAASYGKPSDEGLGVNEDCYYTLETTGIFEQYGRLPDKVHFTVDGSTQYYLKDFKLYKSDPSTTPPTESVVVTKSSNELATSWDASLPTDAVYDPSCTYYAVLKLEDSSHQQLTSSSTPKINLMFSYTGVTSEGASEQLATSTTGTYTVGNCTGQALEIAKNNIDTYGYPEIVVSYNKDNAYADYYCNQGGLKLIINYTRESDGGSDKKEEEISPTSGKGDTSKGKDVVFSQASIKATFEDMKSELSDKEIKSISSYQIQMSTFALQPGGDGTNSIPLDVTATYAGGGSAGGNISADIDVKDNFESKKEELSGNTSDSSDPVAVKICETVGGETAYLVLPNYNTPVSYKNVCAVEITKVDASNKAITGSSASFLLYDENNNLVGSLYGTNGVYAYNADANTANPANSVSAPLMTDPATGMLKVTGLDQGKYYLVETDSPSNYEASAEENVFVLNLSNLSNNPKEVSVKNEVKKGQITLIKTDENGTLKEGATFDLYRVKLENINSATPTDEKIGTYTTLNDGKYTVEVELGYLYYAIETEKGAPSGTVNSNVDVKLPKLDTNGPDASRYVINGNNFNYGIVLAEDIGSGNVKLQVAEKDANGNITYVDKIAYEVVTDASGNPVYKVDENGNTVYETDENGDPTDVPVPELKAAYMDVASGNIGAVNTSVKTTINKFDEDGTTPLAGAVLKLERTDVKSGEYSKPVFGEVKGSIDVTHYIEYVYEEANGDQNLSINTEDKNKRPFIKSEYITWTSGDAANVLSGLPAGTYRLTELDAPEGYAVAQRKDFTVTTADGSVDMIDTKLTGSITLTKRDSVNNARIAGVEFMLQVSDDGNTWTGTGKTYTTGSDGTVTADKLTYGKYYRFKEISTPAGYKANEGDKIYTTSAQVTEDKLTSTVDFENTALTGSVTLTKVEKGNADVKLANAEFQLYYKASTANDSTYILYSDETYKTDENGQIKVENLPWGYTYRFKETKVPTGYAIDSENSTAVALTADDLNKSVTVENIKIVGSVTLTGTKRIEGKDNVTQTFEFVVKEGDKTVATANNTGREINFPAINYTAADIGDHTYVISESKYDADGIKNTDATFEVTVNVALSQDGKSLVATIKEGSDSIAFVNTYSAEPVKASIKAVKTLDGEPAQANAFSFELWSANKVADGKYVAVEKVGDFKNGANGEFTVETDAISTTGTYYFIIKETVPADAENNVHNGIKYDGKQYNWSVQVTDDGNGNLVASKTLDENGDEAIVEFANTSARGTVSISKQKVGGGPEISGAKIEIKPVSAVTFDNSITVTAEDAVVTADSITWTSGDEAVQLTGLPVGTYAMTEKIAPDGYAICEETIYFKLDEDGKIYSVIGDAYKGTNTNWGAAVEEDTVIMEDAPYTAVFSKVDADGGAPLPGATVTITPVGENTDLGNVILPTGVTIVDGSITWRSETEPKTIGALPNGVYKFTETQAPDGYEIAEDMYFKIDGDDVYSVTKEQYNEGKIDWNTVTPAEGDKVIMEDAHNTAVFSKEGLDAGKELPGAYLFIKALDEDVVITNVKVPEGVSKLSDNKTITWKSDAEGPVTLGRLPDGVYEFTEIAPPSGYAMAETIYVKIDGSDVYSATKEQYNEGKIDWSTLTPAQGDKVIMTDAPNSAVFSKEGTDAGKELPGAELYIIPVVSTTDLENVDVPEHVTNKDGMIYWKSGEEATTIGQLPDGEYRFVEKTAPSGYEVSEVIFIKVDKGLVYSVVESAYKGEDTVWGTACDGNKVIMVDAPNTLVLSKKAVSGKDELEGAKLTLAPVSDTDISAVKVPSGATNKDNVISWTSGKTALTLNMVPDGVYKFTETQAPDGYEIAEVIYIKVENGGIFAVRESNYAGDKTLWGAALSADTVLMEDALTPEPEKVNFNFTKYSNIGTTVSGAVFKLTGTNDYSSAATSTGTGSVSFTGLGEGTYTLTETTCPQSYVKSEAIVYIVVDKDGVVTYKDAQGNVITHSQIETAMINAVKPIEDEEKGNVGDVYELMNELLPVYPEYKDIPITWESSDESIVSVDRNTGKATILKVGTATITAKSGDTVLGTFVLGAEVVNGTNDTPNTGDTDAPQTGDYAVGWTIAVVALLGVSAVVAKVSYDKIKRNAKNKEDK